MIRAWTTRRTCNGFTPLCLNECKNYVHDEKCEKAEHENEFLEFVLNWCAENRTNFSEEGMKRLWKWFGKYC